MTGEATSSRRKNRAVIIKNLFFLYIWQAAQYLVPLITLPYLTRVLGPNQFGLMAIATNIAGYVVVITDWGFSLTANQQIARARSDPDAMRQVFWDTLFVRMALGAGCWLVFLPLLFLVPQLRDMSLILVLAFLQIVGNILTVNWFLQGVEKMGSFATASMIGRLATVPATFLLVRDSGDAGIAVAIQSGSACLTGAVSLFLAMRIAPLMPVRTSWSGMWIQLREGWHVFLSQAAVTLYAQSNIVVTGFVAGPEAAGLFSGADRLRRALQSLFGPISMSMFPRINTVMTENKKDAFKLMVRVLILQGAFALCLSIATFVMAHWLTTLILGKEFADAYPVMQILAIAPFLVGLSNGLGIQIMLPLSMKKEFSRILLAAGVLNIFLLFPMTYYFNAIGTAITVVATEAFVTVTMSVLLLSRKSKLMRQIGVENDL